MAELDRNHPCYGCTARPIDHAVICPTLGVIASGRHKRIVASAPAVAWEKLHGLYVVHTNKRTSIKLTSEYWRADGAQDVLGKVRRGVRANADGWVTLAGGTTPRGSGRGSKATRGAVLLGATETKQETLAESNVTAGGTLNP